MQTFLPFPDFEKSAEVLDNKRLGKQRIEALQLVKELLGLSWSKSIRNHPACIMWQNNIHSLIDYGITMCNEWSLVRGFDDTVWGQLVGCLEKHKSNNKNKPSWFGNEDFHLSHKSNLLRKDYSFYSIFFGDLDPTLPYIWPGPG